MPTRVISTRVAIEGENEYKQSVAGINSSLGALKAELGAVKAEFHSNANSMDALRAKGDVLNRLHEEQTAKVKAVAAALENAEKAQRDYAARVETARERVLAAEQGLGQMASAAGVTEQAQAALTDELERYRKELADAERYNEAAQRGVNGWRKELANAQRDLTKTNTEIKQNDQYLGEAKKSADGCATSIDQYGKRVKAAGKETEEFTAKTAKMKAGLDTAADRLDKAGNKLSVGLTAPLVAAGVASANFASDTVESIGKVEVAFGYAAEGIKKWSEDTLTSIGLAKGTALDMAALYGDMATSMGLSQAKAADMAKTLVDLGADLASYKNISIDVANTALKSIFTGETESLKGLGVVMTQANLQAYAMSQGFKTAYKDMDQAQQVAVRYQYVLAQTANAQGDFARTSDNTANQLRVFQESLKEAAALAGDQLLPILTPIISRMSDLVQSFGALDDGTRKAVVQAGLFLALLGPTLKLTGGVTTAVSAGVAAYQALTKATAAAAAAQTGLNAAQMATPIGAIIIAVGALVAVLGSWAITAALTTENQHKLTEELERSREAYQDTVTGIEETRTSTLGMMQSLEQLMAVEEKSAAQKAVIKGLVDQLNKAVPDLSLAYNEQADSLNMTSDTLERYIEVEARRQIQQENAARLIELEKERIRIAEDLEKAQAALYLTKDAYDQAIRDEVDAMGSVSVEGQAAITTYGTAQAAVKTLTDQMEANSTESAELKEKYNNLATSTDKTGTSVSNLAEELEAATVSEEELVKSTRTLISETETLSAAFAEQKENGALSLDTTLKLIEAGYGAALAVDEETGSVRLNAEAYATLAAKKIDEQIAGIQDSQRETKARLLHAEGDAALAAAMGHTALALSYQEAAKAIQGEMVSSDAMIAQLTKLKDDLGTVVTGKWSGKDPTKSSKSKVKTEEERRVDSYKAAVADLDYLRSMDEINEAEYYARLEALRDQYLTADSDAWRDSTVKLHEWRKKRREEDAKAEQEAAAKAAKEKQDAYDRERADQNYFHDMGLTSDSYYYLHLEELRDKYLEEDSEAWRKATVELYNWQQKQREAALAAEQAAYAASQKQRTDLVKRYTDERIASLKAEQKAEEDRINALIDGIDEEIAARKRLRQEEGDEDAIAKAQKTLEAAKVQLTFARDENTRREMEKEVARAQDALNKALQGKADNDFYYAKEQERDALRDQLGAVKDNYQQRIDNAPAWAEQRVADIEAAEDRRKKAEEQRWEKEIAEMEAAQKAAAGALAAAGKVVTQISTAITKVTNNNSVNVTTGASPMTSGQMARAMQKAIEMMDR